MTALSLFAATLASQSPAAILEDIRTWSRLEPAELN